MKIYDLATAVVEKNNPKALYDKMERCKKEAYKVLSLGKCYRRSIQAGDHTYSWNGQIQRWDIRTPKFSNFIPTSVAAEDLSFQLYDRFEWRWGIF